MMADSHDDDDEVMSENGDGDDDVGRKKREGDRDGEREETERRETTRVRSKAFKFRSLTSLG